MRATFAFIQETLQHLEAATKIPLEGLLFRFQDFIRPINSLEVAYRRYFSRHLDEEMGRLGRTANGNHVLRPRR